MTHKHFYSTKRTAYAVISALLFVLTLTSCKIGRAINDFNDHCPITLIEGVTLKEASSINDGKAIEIKLSIATFGVDVPGATSDEWCEVVYEIKSLMRNNTAASDLLNAAAEEEMYIVYTIYDISGRQLYSGTGVSFHYY